MVKRHYLLDKNEAGAIIDEAVTQGIPRKYIKTVLELANDAFSIALANTRTEKLPNEEHYDLQELIDEVIPPSKRGGSDYSTP
jgi:hypothetical protein